MMYGDIPVSLQKKSLFFRSFPKKHKLVRLRKEIGHYLVQFKNVLTTHLSSEFEIQIRDGNITLAGQQTLLDLQKNYDVLQYESRIDEIFDQCAKLIIAGRHSRVYELFCVVKDDILQDIPRIISRIQNNVLKTRRAKDNSLCKIKCGSGPLIHNFTDVKIPQQLTDMLKSGLKFVPHSQCHVDEILSDLDNEAKVVCKNIFYSSYGHYPHVSPGFSLSSSVLQIIAQCVTNSSTISSLINFRDQFLENIPFFINSLPIDGLNVKKMVNLIPQGCIISASDKNIGVSILSPSWYSKEYHSQILKGGHELESVYQSPDA